MRAPAYQRRKVVTAKCAVCGCDYEAWAERDSDGELEFWTPVTANCEMCEESDVPSER